MAGGKVLQLNSAAEAAKQLRKQINGINHENQFCRVPPCPSLESLLFLLMRVENCFPWEPSPTSAANGQLSKAIKASKFEGKRDSVLDCLAPGGGFDRILIVGVGFR